MDYNIKWVNKGGIRESGMTKWIITLHNSNGELVKKIENNERANLNNFSTVNVKLSLTTQEALKQTATNNILKIFFDDETDDTKINQKTISFNRNRLTLGLDVVNSVKYNISPYKDMSGYYTMKLPKDIKLFDSSVADLPVREFTNFIDDVYLHTQPINLSSEYESIFLRFGDKVQGVIQMGETLNEPETSIPYSKTKNYKIWILYYENNNFTKQETYHIQDPFDVRYWKSIFFREVPPEPPKPLVKDEKFTCLQNDPINNGKTNVYKYMGNNEYKWISDTETVDRVGICNNYTYTGKQAGDVSTDGRCGPSHGNKRCPGSQCCSSSGWCWGTIGLWSDWCTNNDVTSDNIYSAYIGGKFNFDGTDVSGRYVTVDETNNSPVSANGRCGWQGNFKRCPGNECCSGTGYCGGSKGSTNYSTFCSYQHTTWGRWSFVGGRFRYYPGTTTYYGSQYSYDGIGEAKPTLTQKKLTDEAGNIVFTCKNNDPFGKNNETLYTWDSATASLKRIASMPSNSNKYPLNNCDGVRIKQA